MKQIKVNIQQPSIPTYRKDFFDKLNNFVSLRIFFGSEKEIPSEFPFNVDLKYYKLYNLCIGKFQIKWHTAQIAAVRKDTDVVILSWDVRYLTLWLAIFKAKIIKKPLILWGHGYSKNDSFLKRKIRNFPAHLAKAIILYDYHTAEELKKIKRLRNKIFVAPNSLDESKIQYYKSYWLDNHLALKQFQNKYGIDKTFNIIYIGRIYKENQLEILLKGVKEASSEIKGLRLIIIGNI